MTERNLYIIAGCNGAGKTTASFTILPKILDCKEFVNADEIAKGLSPFQPEKVAFEAGRIMLNRIDELFERKENFAFETTLATKTYKQKIVNAQRENYVITLLFFWLKTPALARERLKLRVKDGGHNIPTEVIERRYKNGIKNLFEIYFPIVDQILIFDNSEGKHQLIAEKNLDEEINILNKTKFNELKEQYDKRK